MIGWGIAGLSSGFILGQTVCPIVKPIWTPSWTVYSAGWASCALGVVYWITEVRRYQAWAFPFTVVGANALAVYSLAMTSNYWVMKAWKWGVPHAVIDGAYGAMVNSVLFTVTLWGVAFLLYQSRVFIRI